jgi:hypothetical protein
MADRRFSLVDTTTGEVLGLHVVAGEVTTSAEDVEEQARASGLSVKAVAADGPDARIRGPKAEGNGGGGGGTGGIRVSESIERRYELRKPSR